MKTNNTKKRSTQPELDPGLVKAYRAYPAINVDDSVRGMAEFLLHRAWFQSVGALPMAAAAERAWWADAVILAAQEAENAEQACRKLRALEPAIDGRDWLITNEGRRAAWAMITVAVECEQTRWGFESATRH